jgi:hypothetical protein
VDSFYETGLVLKQWANEIEGERGPNIADTTVEAIRKLSKVFRLPEEFDDFITEFRIREGALASIANYRDHFVHPFHVFCMGYHILSKFKKMGRTPLSFSQTDPDLLLRDWYTMSIYHDVGYPLEQLGTLVEQYSNASFGVPMRAQFDWVDVLLSGESSEKVDNLVNGAATRWSSDSRKVVNFRKWVYTRLLKEHEHGMIASLMLLRIKWPQELEESIYECALAIALHGWKKQNLPGVLLEPLKIVDFPYAFFLFFCDTAQEWGREVHQGRILTQRESARWPRARLENISVKADEIKIILRFDAARDFRLNDRGTQTLADALSAERDDSRVTWADKTGTGVKFVIECRDNSSRQGEAMATEWSF